MKRSLSVISFLLIFPLNFSLVSGQEKIPVAGITTLYRQNTHADVLIGRILETDTLDGKGNPSKLKLVSLYVDQFNDDDMSRGLSRKYSFPMYDRVSDALTLGTNKLAVQGVVLVAEHGEYPVSETGQVIYPKKRLFAEIFNTFEKTKQVVPVFSDKHLADSWKDAISIYQTARKMNVPLMAGSSVPSAWRYPPLDVRKGADLQEIVAIGYGPLDAYGFHALEMMQSLAERRQGGESGVSRVRCVTGKDVWTGNYFDRDILDAVLKRLKEKKIPAGKRIEDLTKDPVLFSIEYRDGLKASVLMLNGAVQEFAAGWKYKDQSEPQATLFWLQPVRPYHHFAHLLKGIEKFMQTKQAPWPVERTLLTTGLLDAALISKINNGDWLETPYLDIHYKSNWNWSQPPPPPIKGK